MMRLAYPARIEKQEDSFIVTFPDLPEANMFGNGMGDARASAVYLLDAALACRIKDRVDIPYPASEFIAASNYEWVSPSPLVSVKVMLYMEMRRQGISQAELARRIGVFPTEVDGLLDTKRKSSLPLLEKTFAALGRRLVVSVE